MHHVDAMIVRRSLLVAVVVLSACAHHMIPGTDIEDTSDDRAILQVMEEYKSALEARDAKGILRLLAPDFHDNAGTPDDPDDDLTPQNIATKLPERLARVESLSVSINVRKITVDHDVAEAIYRFSSSYRMPKLTSKPQNDSDLERMTFRRVDGQWKITSGI